jgi:hypothetical protein
MLLGLETMGLAFSFGNPYSVSLENSIINVFIGRGGGAGGQEVTPFIEF